MIRRVWSKEAQLLNDTFGGLIRSFRDAERGQLRLSEFQKPKQNGA